MNVPWGTFLNSSVVWSITSTSWLKAIGLWRLRGGWYNLCRLGVPYNVFRRSRMAGGLSFPNPRLAMHVFIIPPEWYAGSMALLNSCRRVVRMLR